MNLFILKNHLFILVTSVLFFHCASEIDFRWHRNDPHKSLSTTSQRPYQSPQNFAQHFLNQHHHHNYHTHHHHNKEQRHFHLNNSSVQGLNVLSHRPSNGSLNRQTLNGSMVWQTYIDGQGRVYGPRVALPRAKNVNRGQSVADKRGFVPNLDSSSPQIASGVRVKVIEDNDYHKGKLNVPQLPPRDDGGGWRLAHRVKNKSNENGTKKRERNEKRRKGKKRREKRRKKMNGKHEILNDEYSGKAGRSEGLVDADLSGGGGVNGSLRHSAIITNAFSPPAPHVQPFSRIKIFNIRLVINIEDNTGCLQCPGDKIIIVKKGAKCAPLLLPPIISCSNVNVARPLRWSLQGGHRIGRILPEGSHTVILKINSNSKIRYCSFMYHVKVMRCPKPEIVQNGVVDCTEERSWGSNCSFTCNPGFYLLGKSFSECEGSNSSVTWSSPFPVCMEINSCSKLPEITNGVLTCNKTTELFVSSGGSCEYKCKPGYKINDNSSHSFTCHEGKWNNTNTVTCTPITCDNPEIPTNGYVNCSQNGVPLLETDNYAIGTDCYFDCEEDFVIPLSQQENKTINCIGPHWNMTDTVDCRKIMQIIPKPNMCINQRLTTSNIITPAEFHTEDGRSTSVTCSFEGEFDPGVYENICEATDPELGTTTKCQYTVEIIAKGCDHPLPIQNSVVRCEIGLKNGISYPVGTICEFECSSGFVIPTSQMEISKIQCGKNLEWNSTKSPTCRKAIPPTIELCEDISSFVENPSLMEIVIPKFSSNLGNDIDVSCNVTDVQEFGKFINFCTAWDSELRINQTCQYFINVQEFQCSPLTPPTNGHLSCQMKDKTTYHCSVFCNNGFFMPPSYKTLNNTQCDVEVGEWDLMANYKLNHFPDCLGESNSSMKTDLHFNVSTIYDCGNVSSINSIQDNIREGLLERNRIICDQVDCTDFVFLCEQLHFGVSMLETVWNVTAQFLPLDLDEYDENYEDVAMTEAEVLLTKIQEETSKMVSSGSDFHLQLSNIGATVLKDSYKQGPMIVLCIEIGYVVDPDTFRCLQCPTGSFYSNAECFPCPLDTYQDETGQPSCKPCPVGTLTSQEGTRMKAQCSAINQNALDQSHLEDDICNPNPCQNDGSCLVVGIDDFLCFCADNFEGDFCEIQQCSNNFCQNGGTCYVDDDEELHCLCPSGTTGKKCETKTGITYIRHYQHPCSSSPCIKDGLCLESKDSTYYYCQCSADRAGDHCEHGICPTLYQRWFCLNEGQCVILDDTHAMVCLCKDGFMGSRCEFLDGGGDEILDESTSTSLM